MVLPLGTAKKPGMVAPEILPCGGRSSGPKTQRTCHDTYRLKNRELAALLLHSFVSHGLSLERVKGIEPS